MRVYKSNLILHSPAWYSYSTREQKCVSAGTERFVSTGLTGLYKILIVPLTDLWLDYAENSKIEFQNRKWKTNSKIENFLKCSSKGGNQAENPKVFIILLLLVDHPDLYIIYMKIFYTRFV